MKQIRNILITCPGFKKIKMAKKIGNVVSKHCLMSVLQGLG